ncbi:hypothetical protein GNY06_12595 [Elizabethkingia argentiflava]|uniref:Uncharacterized protein n=1 Tax=Elizabethkingia argenteiflava TaxID=2681556 RepID=A0A845Q0G4_9FLAO|nr:hypothetical protein [Elizabethkingia argenteiflava]NAW52177.1 hypothetical protein [Elizabethkingia argenteiflava]
MNALDTLNNKNLMTHFKLVIQTGIENILEFPQRKDTLSNWGEENGQEYDLEMVRFNDKEVSLNCVIVADNDTEFWIAYHAFFSEITKPGWQELFIHDHSQTYKVFYKKTASFKKALKRLKNTEKVFVKFQLSLQIKTP